MLSFTLQCPHPRQPAIARSLLQCPEPMSQRTEPLETSNVPVGQAVAASPRQAASAAHQQLRDVVLDLRENMVEEKSAVLYARQGSVGPVERDGETTTQSA